MRLIVTGTLAVAFLLSSTAGYAFDQSHSQFNALLQKNVVWIDNGKASRVKYAQMKKDHQQLENYLQSVSKVTQAQYNTWTKSEQLAFLINAYNGFTIELILTKYPHLNSIKDLGSFFSSPWKKDFFTLLGKKRSLDDIEHGLIRKEGVFNEPRIHFAVVCAAIGCPALRNEAYTADRLDWQLTDNLKRFLKDRSRNRYDAARKTLEVSKIFDWYKKDFEKGYHGYTSLKVFFAKYADVIADNPKDIEVIKGLEENITYLDYDWRLNDFKN